MPITFEKDPKTGRWRQVGSLDASDRKRLADQPPPAPKPAGRSATRATAGAANSKPPARPWWWHLTPQGLGNELTYRGGQINRFNQGQVLRSGSAGNPLMGGDPVYFDTRKKPTDPTAYSSTTRATQQVAAGALAQAPANAALAAVNLGQRIMSGQPLKPQRPEASPQGRAILSAQETVTRALGATPKSQLSAEDKAIFNDLPASLATNVGLAFVGPLRAAGPAVGAIAARMPGLSTGAAGVLAKGLSWGTTAGINEGLSSILDDSTQGTGADLLNAAGVPVPKQFLTTPEDDRISAGLKGVIPGLLIGEAVGAVPGVAFKATELAPNALRAIREHRIKGEVSTVRRQSVADGLQQQDLDSGEYQISPEVKANAAAAAAELRVVRNRQGARSAAARQQLEADAAAGIPDVQWAEGDKPTTAQGMIDRMLAGTTPTPRSVAAGDTAADALGPDPLRQQGVATDPAAVDPIDVPDQVLDGEEALPPPDPSLPEYDAAALALGRLDDDGLQELYGAEGELMPQLEQRLSQQSLPEPDPAVSTQYSVAPTRSLAEPTVPYAEQWEGLSNQQLLGVAHPDASPDLYERVQSLTGRDWAQFTRGDVIEGLDALRNEGMTVLPQRLSGGQVLADVNSLVVDPARLQFRAGADPATGVVPGQEIQGLWDPSQEGAIRVWQDPQTGQRAVVDGHRRVEAARRLGVRTLPAEESLTATADAARLEGAAVNIGQGTASPVDGGRALRQMGITDPAGLEAAGIPLETGAGSVAVARLPEPVSRAAGSGALPATRAMAIGGSGLDEAGMTAAARFSGTKAGQALSDAEFAELMALSGPQARTNQLAQVEEIKQAIDSTNSYYAGPVKLEREVYDNGSSRNVVEVATAEMLPAEFLAAKGVTDPKQLSSRRQMTLLREFTMQELRKLPPGDYAMDALTDKHAAIYSRWFDGGKVSGITPATEPLTEGMSWTYRPQDDPKSLVSQAAGQQASPSAVPTAATFNARVSEARMAAAVRNQLPAELQQVFDTTKRQEGPVAQLLVQGGAEVAAGALPEVVSRRIAMQIERVSGDLPAVQPAAGPAVADGAAGLSAADRQLMRNQLLARAIQGGEIRPSASPMLPSPDLPDVDVPSAIRDLQRQLQETGTVKPDTPGARLLEKEAQLASHYSERDAAISQEMARAQREAEGYWFKSDQEKLAGIDLSEWQRPRRPAASVAESTASAGSGKAKGPRKPETPYFIDLGGDANAALKIEGEVDRIVRTVAGADADLRLKDYYQSSTKPVAWGGDGKAVSRQMGTYDLVSDLVTVNGLLEGTQRDLYGTAFHESFHRLQMGLLTEKELKVMNTAFGVERVNDYSGLNPDKVSTMERMATAFQAYATSRAMGGDAMKETMTRQLGDTLGPKSTKLVVDVIAAFEKVREVAERFRNAWQGLGFTSADDIFDRAFRGEIARRRAFDSALELVTKDQAQRFKTLERWMTDNKAPVQEIGVAISRVDQQIAALKTKALTQGC